MDKRILKTKRAIKNAYAELLSYKNINDITIKDIADGANISRKTFYFYYQGIWEIDEERIGNYFVLDYKYSPQSFIVTDLPEPEAVDPFDGLELEFIGRQPYITAYVRSPFLGFPYTITPNGNLKNGDTITIKFDFISKVSMIEYYGKYPTRDTIEYTISGLGEADGIYVFKIPTNE